MENDTEQKIRVKLCMIGLMLLVAFSALAAGAMMWLSEGYSRQAMMLVACGGTISFIVSGGMLCASVVSARNSPPPSSGPRLFHDPPPNYRNTWRLQFLDKSPDHLRDELERDQPKHSGAKTHVHGIWNSPEEAQFHGRSQSYVYTISETPAVGRSSSSLSSAPENLSSLPGVFGVSGRPEGASTVPTVSSNIPVTSENCSSGGRRSISVVPEDAAATISHIDYNDGLPSYAEIQLW